MKYWSIQPDWKGKTAVIVCGGTSVTPEMLKMVRERRLPTIAVNSSYLAAPWADLLFFADHRWWDRELKERPKQIAAFKGRIVTVSQAAKGDRLLRLRRAQVGEEGLSPKNYCATVERTSMQAALNICLHRRAKRILLLGADNRDGPDGRAHHHAEYPWRRSQKGYTDKLANLEKAVEPLRRADIEVINCSPISTLPWWPRMTLEEALNEQGD